MREQVFESVRARGGGRGSFYFFIRTNSEIGGKSSRAALGGRRRRWRRRLKNFCSLVLFTRGLLSYSPPSHAKVLTKSEKYSPHIFHGERSKKDKKIRQFQFSAPCILFLDPDYQVHTVAYPTVQCKVLWYFFRLWPKLQQITHAAAASGATACFVGSPPFLLVRGGREPGGRRITFSNS